MTTSAPGSPGQKHAFFYVPNYDQSNPEGGNHGSPLTYLRLGSDVMETKVLTSPRERGDDLLERAGLAVGERDYFEDDSRMTQPAASTSYFRYDGRQAATSEPATDRNDLTEQLRGTVPGADGSVDVYARGGWRDHTDGNRITTVRGDRVDIVMGNYMRVVFGRVTGPDPYIKKAWWEVSGGHIFAGDSTRVAALTSIEWINDPKDGVDYWQVVETTHKGDCIIRYSGVVEEHFNGPLQKATIGVDGGSTTQNPQITEERHVVSETIDTQCDTSFSRTEAKTVSETTVGTGSIDSTTSASTKVSTMGVGSAPVATFNDALFTGASQTNFEATGVKAELEIGGMLRDNGGRAFAFSLTLVEASFSLGGSISFYLGTKTELTIGASINYNKTLCALSALIGAKVSIILSEKNDVTTLKADARIFQGNLVGSMTNIEGVRKTMHAFKNKT